MKILLVLANEKKKKKKTVFTNLIARFQILLLVLITV